MELESMDMGEEWNPTRDGLDDRSASSLGTALVAGWRRYRLTCAGQTRWQAKLCA